MLFSILKIGFDLDFAFTFIPTPNRILSHAESKTRHPHELAGVLNWALGGLQRLLERGKFAPAPALVQRATDGGKKETNNVISWLDNNEICVDHGVETMKDEVYTTYHRWCLLNGTSPVSSEKFWKRLSVCLKTEFPEKKGGGFVNGVRKRGRVVPIRLPVN